MEWLTHDVAQWAAIAIGAGGVVRAFQAISSSIDKRIRRVVGEVMRESDEAS